MDNKIISILSARKWNDYFPLQVVYEWEDIIAKELNIAIDTVSQITINKIYEHPLNFQFQKLVRRSFLKKYIDSSLNYLLRKFPEQTFLIFLLYPQPIINQYYYNKNCIIILLDCFADTIDKVPDYFKNIQWLFVTNLEVYNYLQNTSIANKVSYIPLSISDIYYNIDKPIKTIDVLQMGRQNKVLHDWMLLLTNRHPSIEYVYLKEYTNGKTAYYSTTKGWLTQSISTRADFMRFLGSAKVSLLSAPGIDGGEKRTGGYNPVTPRFYESAVNECYMIGRFPDTPDFIYNKVSDVCNRPESYSAFEAKVLQYVREPFNLKDAYKPFIESHLTSTVASLMKKRIDFLI